MGIQIHSPDCSIVNSDPIWIHILDLRGSGSTQVEQCHMTVAGEEMAELLMSGQLAFMLAKSAAWSSSLQAALHTIASAFRQVPPHPCFKDGF